LRIKRDPYFYMVYYIVPSVIFVILSYCSFWIDQESVTARCSLAITTVLITINFSNGINTILPPFEYPVWLETYFTGILIFTCFSMLEYAIVNFCHTNYKLFKQQIEDTVNNLRVNLSKFKKKLAKRLHAKRYAMSLLSNEDGTKTEGNDNMQTEARLMTAKTNNTDQRGPVPFM
jgi:hypothetical protein